MSIWNETWVYRVLRGALLLNVIRYVYYGNFRYGLWRNTRKCLSWTDFLEIWYCRILIICRENTVSLQSDKNNGTVHEGQYTLWSYLVQVFLEWEMFQTKVVEKIRENVLCLITPFPADHAVYEIMWKDRAIQLTDDNIIRRAKDAICMQDNWGNNNTRTRARTHIQ
jgi:hypothetical protein